MNSPPSLFLEKRGKRVYNKYSKDFYGSGVPAGAGLLQTYAMEGGNALRRGIAFCLAVLLLLCSCGRGSGGEDAPATTEPASQQTEASGPLSENAVVLAFNVNDSLNPYTAASKQNQDLSTLLYEPLVYLNENFEAQMCLAKVISGEGVSYTIALRDGAVFSDGTAVEASDVVYSFGLAKANPKWSAGLQQIASMAVRRGDISVTLTAPNILFQNLLDFPIIKQEGAESGTPAGSGRYVYQKQDTVSLLTANPHYSGAAPQVGTIRLADVPDDEALQNSLQIGSITAYYTDLADCNIPRLTGKTARVNLTNMVYIGANASRGALGNEAVRRAVSKAVNRETIAQKAYYSYAEAATGPLPPQFKALDISNESFYIQNKEEAVSLLESAGFTEEREDGVRTNGQVALEVSLLVNEENAFRTAAASLVQRQLEEAGFGVTVETLPFADYSARIRAGDYDLYMGEIRLSNDMDLSPLLVQGGVSSYGLAIGAASAEYAGFRSGEGAPSAFGEAFQTSMPFIPLVYRQGVLTYPGEVGTGVRASVSDVYLNIGSWAK